MFYILLLIAAALFIMHVGLLLRSFPGFALHRRRYFYSHLTLWLTGVTVFLLAGIYHGTGRSGFLDYFDTLQKRLYILGFTLALSIVAHIIVRLAVLPLLRKQGVK